MYGFNQVVPFEGRRAVMVSTMRGYLVLDSVNVLHVGAIKDCLTNRFGRRRFTPIGPNMRVGSLKEVDLVLWEVRLQTALRSKSGANDIQ